MAAAKAEKIKGIFQKYDVNGDGTISKDELRAVLKGIAGDVTEAELDSIFTHIDQNHDGCLQYDEFVDWILDTGRQDRAVRRSVLAIPTGSGGSLSVRDTFNAYCASGDMDGKTFAKLCKDCGLVDKKFTTTDADLIFTKVKVKGGRRIVVAEFEEALGLVAERKGCEASVVLGAVAGSSGGPVLQATKADDVRFHDDKSSYTGTHVHGGPSSVAKGAGSGPGGFDGSLRPNAPAAGAHARSASPAAPARPAAPVAAPASPAAPARPAVPVVPPASPAAPARPAAPVAAPPPGSPSGPRRPAPKAAAADRAASPRTPADRPAGSVAAVFRTFCGDKADMDGKTFTKLCKDCGLVDRHMTVTDADLVFAKSVVKGQRRLDLHQFQAALGHVAAKRGVELAAVTAAVAGSAGPELNATRADDVRFHDDKSTYTGTHVNGGPQAGGLGSGTATQLASCGMHVGQ